MHWFDAHLDLAYLAENGRDMHASLSDCRGRYQPAAVTLPSMNEGKITQCLATVFTEGIDPNNPDSEAGAFTYPFGDADAAYGAGMRQLLLYRTWFDAGLISRMPRRGETATHSDAPLKLGVLVECADPITNPDELDQWAELGVVAVGMAWWHQSRYAGGNGTDHHKPGNGLTDLGRTLVKRMDELNIVHDLSHLSQRSTDELLAITDRAVIASHSNSRSLMGDQDSLSNQRHLADETIIEIAKRGGVIGLNLLGDFVTPNMKKGERAKISDCVRHIEHICELTNSRSHVGLGSDMDGGFGADGLPHGINQPSDLTVLTDALMQNGWSDKDIQGFAHGNWERFWA
ncbi:MAG: membrane dipeptidase [Phycisphaerales bacterium]|nr:membrane dipeptidase [Phycisphaerales bacterium]